MDNKNNEQNSAIFSIAEILGKMSNQVSFLIRNNKLMSQLDVDMLMENTRKLYDTICSVRCNMDVDSIPMEVVKGDDPHDDKGVEVQRYKGIEVSDESEVEEERQQDLIEDDDPIEDDHINDEEEAAEDDYEDEEADDEELVDDDYINDEEADEVDYKDEDEFIDDEYEDDEADEDIVEDDYIDDEDDAIRSSLVAQASDDEGADEIKIDFEIPSQETPSPVATEDSGIRAYKKVNNEYYTLGDVLEQTEDRSLAARLQKKAVTDIATAIGINDKFLLLNELFGGSMEKYNKSIRALNNFSTYLGAMTYMSELQIELQWDCDSDAYKKLTDLIERRFS